MPKQKKIHIDRDVTTRELIAGVVCVIVLCFIGSFAIIANTSLRNFIPGYPNEDMRNEIAVNAMKIDSLERSIYRWELYSRNLRDVLQGQAPVQIDSLLKKAVRDPETKEIAASSADSALRAKINSPERKSGTPRYSEQALEGRHLFTPVPGHLMGKFEISLHPYVDIAAEEGSSVRAVLDGTVIFKDWNEVDGWSVVLQHSGGTISVYKHNNSILKNLADKVSAGTAIAILGGNSFDASKGPHLHFELWHNGMPEDPARFINFQQ